MQKIIHSSHSFRRNSYILTCRLSFILSVLFLTYHHFFLTYHHSSHTGTLCTFTQSDLCRANDNWRDWATISWWQADSFVLMIDWPTILQGQQVNWWFEPSQPLWIISRLKETFIKRYPVKRTNKADIRPEEQSQKTESYRENLSNATQSKRL